MVLDAFPKEFDDLLLRKGIGEPYCASVGRIGFKIFKLLRIRPVPDTKLVRTDIQ